MYSESVGVLTDVGLFCISGCAFDNLIQFGTVHLHFRFWCLRAQSRLTLCDPWTIACQAPLSVGFPRLEYWSGLPLPPPGDLPDPKTEPVFPASSALGGSLAELPGFIQMQQAPEKM